MVPALAPFAPRDHQLGVLEHLEMLHRRAAAERRNVSIEEKIKIQEAFQKLPRNSCPTRLKSRCAMTGRGKAYYRKFGISRIGLRELALAGQLPGVRKSSW